ncbi:unnamed protein product [Rotaria sp. Silwood2]|nr:unnamed protein product [Rotaria sp. Silwood2]
MPTGTLEVFIAEGRHLKDRDIIGKNDAYVEVYLEKKYKQRTKIIKNTNDPVWNERFTFNIHKGDDTIHFDVYDDDLIGRDSVGSGKIKLKHVFDDGKFDEWIKLPAKLGLSSHGEIHVIMNFTPITIKPIEIPDDKENSNDHAQIRTNIKSGSQSAHASSKSRSIIDYEQPNRNIITVHGVRPHHNYTTDSTASIPIINHKKDEKKPLSKMTRPSSRTLVVKSTLQEFRQYPERFLSKTNRYLPLLRHQAVKTTESNKCHTKQEKEHTQFSSSNSHHSSETNVTFDDESLSLIEEVKERKSDIDSHISDLINHDHRQSKEVDKLNKIDLMKTVSDDKSERKLALLRLRDREYNHLQTLIHSNRIDHILKPLSSIKTIENQSRKTINLNYILNSMDSFYCSKTLDKHKRKQISIDKNPSKLPILIS